MSQQLRLLVYIIRYLEMLNLLEADKHRGRRQTSTKHHFIGEKVEWCQAGAGIKLLPDDEEDHADDAKNQHTNKRGRIPLNDVISSQADTKEYERECRDDENDSDNCKRLASNHIPDIRITHRRNCESGE